MDAQVNGHAVTAGNPVIPPPPRVLLAASSTADFIADTMVPRLRDIGADVVDVVSVRYRGPITREKCSVVAFAFERCGHDDQAWFKSKCKLAGVQFILLSRKSAHWPTAFRKMGIKLSGVPVTTPLSLPKPQIVTPGPLPPVTPAPPPPPRFAPIILPKAKPTDAALSKPPVTAPVAAAPEKTASKPKFGKTLRACRVEDRSSVGDLADLLGISEGLVYRIEIDDVPVARDIYQRIVELYPKCGEAEPPPFTKGTARNPRVGTRKPVAEPAAPEPTRPIAAPAAVVAPAPAPMPTAPVKAGLGSLTGLQRAAKVLGMTGDLVVRVSDAGVAVEIGAERWAGKDDGVVAQARMALDGKLTEMLRSVELARAGLAG